MPQHTSAQSFSYSKMCVSGEEASGIHIHKLWQLVFVAGGAGERETGGTVSPFSVGELFLIPPDMPHGWRFLPCKGVGGEKTCLICVNFPQGLFSRLAAVFPEFGYMPEMFGDRSKAWTFKKTVSLAVGRIMASMANEGGSMRVASLVEILARIASARNPQVAGITSHKAKEEGRCREIDGYLAATPIGEINAEDAARLLGMQPTTFCNFFKKNYGTNFVDFVNARKVEKACALIRKGGRSMQEVCGESGFNSMVYFIRIFKRIKGITPARWAKENY